MMAGKGEWLQKSKKGNTPVKFAVADRLLKVRFPTVKVKNPSPKKWLSDAFSSDEDMIDALSAIPTQSIESTTENISAYDAYDPSKFNPDDFTMTSTPVDTSL